MTLHTWYALCAGILEGPSGEVFLLPHSPYKTAPSFNALPLPWHPNHSILLAEMYDDATPWVHCPKACLIRAVTLLRQLHISVSAGFELEFTLFHSAGVETGDAKPFGYVGNYAAFSQFDAAATILDEMVATLEEMNIHVLMLHAEGGMGQYELVLAHKPVLDAVDDVLLAREAVRAIARKHQLHATFVPKYRDSAVSGSHVHLSLDGEFKTEDVLFGHRIGMSKTAQHFMAGVVESLPWLMFLVNASELSYERTKPCHWAGAYKVWGMNNKEAPVRLAMDTSNFEFKTLDGVSNIYLAMAAILFAGLSGVRQETPLGEPCQVDPFGIAEDVRPERLPTSLEASLECFLKKSQGGKLEEVFTKEMIHDLVQVKREEIDWVRKNGMDEFQKLMLRYH